MVREPDRDFVSMNKCFWIVFRFGNFIQVLGNFCLLSHLSVPVGIFFRWGSFYIHKNERFPWFGLEISSKWVWLGMLIDGTCTKVMEYGWRISLPERKHLSWIVCFLSKTLLSVHNFTSPSIWLHSDKVFIAISLCFTIPVEMLSETSNSSGITYKAFTSYPSCLLSMHYNSCDNIILCRCSGIVIPFPVGASCPMLMHMSLSI